MGKQSKRYQQNEQNSKTGYLKEDFRVFHLTDCGRRDFDFHYHDFHKILLFMRGNVSYVIEGRHFELQPGDVLFVRAGELHHPVVNDDTPYERIILYLSPVYCKQMSTPDCILDHFVHDESFFGLIRSDCAVCDTLRKCLTAIAGKTAQPSEFGGLLFGKTLLTQILILMNRALLDGQIEEPLYHCDGNRTVAEIMEFINRNLTSDLDIDSISSALHVSRSYLMHSFKKETGCTIGQYITDKRLFLAKSYIAAGQSVTESCYKSGFRNYSVFYHAYTKKYHSMPKEAYRPGAE